MTKNDICCIRKIDVPNACYHCIFHHMLFRSDDNICRFREVLKDYVDASLSIRISNDEICTCDFFTPYDIAFLIKDIKNVEEFNILNDLGKFSSLSRFVIEMFYNFFMNDNTASDKQMKFEEYIAKSTGILPPMMIDLNTFDGIDIDILPVNNKSIVWKWSKEHTK